MLYSQFALGKTYIKFYSVKSIPLILSFLIVSAIYLFFYFVHLINSDLSSNSIQRLTPEALFIGFVSLLIIFYFAVYIIYCGLRWFIWRFVQNTIEADGYTLYRLYPNNGKKKVSAKILSDYPNIENMDMVLVLYKHTYFLYKL